MKKINKYLLLLGLLIAAQGIVVPLMAQEDYRISGKVLTTTGHRMPNVEVYLIGNTQIWMDTTGADGLYSFEDIPGHDNYILEFRKEGDLTNGLSTEDVRLLGEHLVGTKTLNYNGIFAADVNYSWNVTPLDAVAILRSTLFGKEDLITRNWQFLYAYSNFNATNPWVPEPTLYFRLNIYLFLQLDQNWDNIDFVGSKMGDINQSANPFE